MRWGGGVIFSPLPSTPPTQSTSFSHSSMDVKPATDVRGLKVPGRKKNEQTFGEVRRRAASHCCTPSCCCVLVHMADGIHLARSDCHVRAARSADKRLAGQMLGEQRESSELFVLLLRRSAHNAALIIGFRQPKSPFHRRF